MCNRDPITYLKEKHGVNVEQILPLSYNQWTMWMMQQLSPENPAYNLSLTVHISSPIEIDSMHKALQMGFDRQPMVRTAYDDVAGQPFQIIYKQKDIVFEVVDAAQWDANTLSQQLEKNLQRPFNLQTGYVLRAILYVQENDQYILQFVIHHIAGDGWSAWVTLKDLQEAYAAIQNGKDKPLPELSGKYTDFVTWQSDFVSSPAGEADWSFWQEELSGDLLPLDLPTDYYQAKNDENGNTAFRFVLDAELTGKLRQLAHEENTTLYKTMLTAFQILLWRYSRQEDILICTPVLGRSKREYMSVVGFFVNTIVMRGKIDFQQTFRAQLQKTNKHVEMALDHSNFPFPLLVERLSPEREDLELPLTQVLFNLIRPPRRLHGLFRMSMGLADEEELELGPFTVSGLDIHTGQQVEGFHLSLDAFDFGDCIVADLKYSSHLYERETIERMVAHLQTLLANIVANPDQLVADLSMMVDKDWDKFTSWNETAVSLPRNQFIHTLFEEQAQRTPEATAVIFGKQQLTYAELNHKANQLAHYLQSMGIGPEKIVGVSLNRSADMIVALLAILKAGGAYLPLDPSYPSDRLAYMIAEARPHLLLTKCALKPLLSGNHLSGNEKCVCLDEDWEKIAHQRQENPELALKKNNLAYIIYTSGSTGKPKGVQIEHRNVVNFLTAMQKQPGITASDILLSVTTFSFDISVLEIFLPLSVGAQVVVVDQETAVNGKSLLQAINQHQITILQATPATWSLLVDADWQETPSLKKALCGGEALMPALATAILDHDIELWNMYGPTETTVWSTIFQVHPDTTKILIGQPIANTGIHILDPNQRPVPIGVPGELHISGFGLSRGYLNKPELTAKKFIPAKFDVYTLDDDSPYLYKTGDLARYLPDGNIEFLGRLDDQVKIRGYRIEPGEIEAVLLSHPSIQQTAVTVHTDNTNQNRLVAYLVAHSETPPARKELRQFLMQKLPDYMIPSAFVVLAEIPLTTSGKINRKALPKPDIFNRNMAQPYVKPRNPQEQMLCDIWAEVLHITRVGIDDNFFELGGHSLLATQVVSRMEKAAGVSLPLRALFESPTVAELSETLNQMRRAASVSPAPIIKRRPYQDDVIPLSFSQERMWFLHQLSPDNYAYHIPLSIRIQQSLNRDALQATLDNLVVRHESLRTIFPVANGVPRQEIVAPFSVPIIDVDLSETPVEVQEEIVAQMIQEDIKRPYDLIAAPPWHFTLFYLNDNDYVFYFSFHHIISDQWSLAVLWQDFNTFYQAQLHGEPPDLPEIDIQYADFSVWQRDWLQGSALETHLDYWRNQLADLPKLEMPTDHPRPPIQTFSGGTEFLKISPALASALRTFSREEQVSLFMLLFAAFKLLLVKYTGQSDFAIGVPVANRQYIEIEPLVGTFVNTLVVRLKLEDDLTFMQLLDQVRDVLLDAYAYQDLPFEKLVSEIVQERDLSQTPLVQVLFNMTNVPFDHESIENSPGSVMMVDREAAQFDIAAAIIMEEHLPIEPIIAIEYNTALYEQETIQRFLTHYERLLKAVIADADKPVSQYNLLSEIEKQQIITDWNQTQMAYPQCGLHELFMQQAQALPEATAVTYHNQSLTYHQLDARSNQLAWYLKKLGVGPETVVGVFVERSLEMVVGLLGILKAGGAYLPLDPSFPAERLRFMVEDTATTIILTQADLASVSPANQVEHPLCLDTEWQYIAQESTEALPITTTPKNLAYLIYTSGSTGKPKGVQIEHRNVVNFLTAMQQQPGITADDVLLSVTTLSFDISILEIFLPLVNGAQVVLVDRLTAVDGREIIKAINQNQATIMQATPTTWSMLVEAGWQNTPSLRLVLCGGEAMSRELANAILERDVALWNMYGPTETTIWSSVQHIKQESGRITIGRPIGNNTFYVLDPAGQPVPIGVVGELHIGGDGVARGYLNRQELTRERFLPDPFTSWSSTKQMYRTGDLARYLADGSVEYLGRLDFQVKIHGHRIELGEIAAILSEHPHVRQVVVTVYSNNGDQSLVAYLLTHEDIEKPTISDLREYLRNHLPGYMIPAAFVYLTEFPLTPNRKIDTRALPPPDKSLGVSQEFVAPRNHMEEMLLPIWQDVLQREPISIYDNFFELGGHSLIAARLFAEIEAVTGKTMPLAQLFSAPTIAELSAYMIVEHEAPDLSVIVPIQPTGDKPPFFYVAPYSISVLQLHDIAQNFSERPFYGIQPLGLGEGEETHTSIEAMAAHNIEAMRSIQPQGPYYLGGHCSGSWVAYEMAAQLEQLGESVAYLAIVDNHAPTYREPERGSVRHQISRLLYYMSDRRLFHALAWQIKLFAEKWLFFKHGTAAQQRIQVVRNTHDRAFENYKATHTYTGPMTIIRSSENLTRYATADWYKLWQEMTTQEIRIIDIHSTHAMLVFNPQAQQLAHHILTGIEQSNT